MVSQKYSYHTSNNIWLDAHLLEVAVIPGHSNPRSQAGNPPVSQGRTLCGLPKGFQIQNFYSPVLRSPQNETKQQSNLTHRPISMWDLCGK